MNIHTSGLKKSHLETLLEVLVFLEESCIIDNDLCVGYTQLENFVIHSFRRVNSSDRLLKVYVKGPELQRLEEAGLS